MRKRVAFAKRACCVVASAAIAASMTPMAAVAAYADDVVAGDGSGTQQEQPQELYCVIFNIAFSDAETVLSAPSIKVTQYGTDTVVYQGIEDHCEIPAGNYTYTIACDGYSDATGTFAVNADTTQNVVLQAKVATYTVLYTDGEGGKVFADKTFTVEAGQPTPTFTPEHKKGWEFQGWDEEIATTVTDDAVYIAEWARTITRPKNVKAYTTLKAKYNGGSKKTYAKDKKEGKAAEASTTSSSKYLTAISLSLGKKSQNIDQDVKYTFGIKYRTLSDGKWGEWKKNGKLAKRGKRNIEAVQIKLTGTVAKYYDVYYTTRVRDIGWMDWGKNGQKVGTSGYDRSIYGLKVVLHKKGAKTGYETANKYITSSTVSVASGLYQLNSDKKFAGANGAKVGGTSSTSKSASRVSFKAKGIKGGVVYRVFQGNEWKDWTSDGKLCGTKSQYIKAMEINFQSGTALKKYCDIYYRVYVPGYGWMDWAKNGFRAGSELFPYMYVSGFQVKVVLKGEKAPGSTAKPYAYGDDEKMAAANAKKWEADVAGDIDDRAKSQTSDTNYLLMVDTSNCRMALYKGSKNNWTRVKYLACGVGKTDSATQKGSYTIKSIDAEYHNDKQTFSVYNLVTFGDNELVQSIHSEVYKYNTTTMSENGVGTHSSNGSIRLSAANAKWLYSLVQSNTVKVGTKVHIF